MRLLRQHHGDRCLVEQGVVLVFVPLQVLFRLLASGDVIMGNHYACFGFLQGRNAHDEPAPILRRVAWIYYGEFRPCAFEHFADALKSGFGRLVAVPLHGSPAHGQVVG